ncbi:cysteine hydrolase [Neobacillus sp. PS3-40]|uniref:cysteine hydrolase family protein n=1 Tax=Neobacillus sp. PS3-40 TaxID=3070679 RepID=UPI0027DFF6A6|nr:cysteine hydrolase [Neobacillus sp. PS3-40]WML43939.1 cysteine hydrolase [Neobacillus sp. PS3-40]
MELRGKKHAIVVIDMLNDFISENGALVCKNGVKIVPQIRQLLDFAHENNIQVIHVQEAHRQKDRDFRVRPIHAIKGTWGSDFIPELQPEQDKGDYVVQKRRHSAFSYTDFDLFCREEEIDTLVLTGVWTNVCVRSTASDGLYHGYNIICVSDATTSQDDDMHVSGLRDIDIFGDIMSVEEYTTLVKEQLSQNQNV